MYTHGTIDVRGIALDGTVRVNEHSASFEFCLKGGRGGLARETGDDNCPHEKPPAAKVIDELQRVGIVGDPEVGPHLLAFDVAGINAEDDFDLVTELLQQTHLHVGVETRQDARRVKVEQELAPELQIELVVETLDPFQDSGRLFRKILVVVERQTVSLRLIHRCFAHCPSPHLTPSDEFVGSK